MTELLIAQIVVAILLALIFLIRPAVTASTVGKMLAFVALAIFPSLCLIGGWNLHMQRSQQTRFCISCHAMVPYGQSLYIDDPNYLPAVHFQNHLVPADEACYACHADYTAFGTLKDKLRGLTRVYMQYISTPPQQIRIPGGYQNNQCLHCHGGARRFEENAIHAAILDDLVSGRMSCLASGCHDSVHNVSQIQRLKLWKPGR